MHIEIIIVENNVIVSRLVITKENDLRMTKIQKTVLQKTDSCNNCESKIMRKS